MMVLCENAACRYCRDNRCILQEIQLSVDGICQKELPYPPQEWKMEHPVSDEIETLWKKEKQKRQTGKRFGKER